MTGWSGGMANRSWQRDSRGPDSGRISLVDDVRRILAEFRAAHGWEPGFIWDPHLGTYRKVSSATPEDSSPPPKNLHPPMGAPSAHPKPGVKSAPSTHPLPPAKECAQSAPFGEPSPPDPLHPKPNPSAYPPRKECTA